MLTTKLHPQYLVDNSGKKMSVLLPMRDFEVIMDELEELEDIRLYDEAMSGEQEYLSAEEVFRSIEAKRKK
jgi:PHD/YefM family antitoxin component YafN of YafNO toxin-antitoxin module